MKITKTIILAIIISIGTITMSFATNSGDSLIGTYYWEAGQCKLILKEGGIGSHIIPDNTYDFKWKVKGNKLFITGARGQDSIYRIRGNSVFSTESEIEYKKLPVTSITSRDRITINVNDKNFSVRDFFKDSGVKKDSEKSYVIRDNSKYLIGYSEWGKTGQFSISPRDAKNLEACRREAERTLLQVLDIGESTACQMDILVEVSGSVSRRHIGQYGFGNCPRSNPIPK